MALIDELMAEKATKINPEKKDIPKKYIFRYEKVTDDIIKSFMSRCVFLGNSMPLEQKEIIDIIEKFGSIV